MKNRLGASKRRCQRKKTLDDPSGIATWPASGFLLSRPTQKLWFIWVQPSWGPFCSRSDVSSLCWPRRTQWPQLRHTGWRFPYSGLWICLQKPALAASLQRGHPSQLLPSGHLEYSVSGRVRWWSCYFLLRLLGRRSLWALGYDAVDHLIIPLLFISAAGFSLVQSTRSLSLLAVQTHLALLRNRRWTGRLLHE